MNKLNGHSTNHQEELLELLRSRFPEVFTEDNRVDVEKLRATLGEQVELSSERYGLSRAGKSDCFSEIQKTTTATLEPDQEESVNFEDTENITGGPLSEQREGQRETTRATIAKMYIIAFLLIIACALGWLLVRNKPVEDIKDVLLTISAVLSGPLGFIIGYYFKTANNW